MTVLQSGLIPSTEAGYQIQRSLRFNSADSAYLNRTPGVAGNLQAWTFSAWVKLADVSTSAKVLFQADTASVDTLQLNNSALDVTLGATNFATTAVFRDPSSWYHIVWNYNGATTVVYVNNVSVGSAAKTGNTKINSAIIHYIGTNGSARYFSGYMTEINFIDGQALTPSSFGQTNANTGVWQPKKYTGTYGTNGFYLNFSDNSNTTATTLGKDSSGNGNNWTPNNFSVTAGAGNDSLVDTPTPYGTDTGSGGEVRGNYATLNPLNKAGSQGTVSSGNLVFSGVLGSRDRVYGTVGMDTGKWYWETVVTAFAPSGNNYLLTGVSRATTPSTTSYDGTALSYIGGNDATVSGYKSNLNVPSNVAYGASWTTNDVIGVALDMDNGTLTFYKNGVSQGVAFSSINSTYPGTYFPIIFNDGSAPNATWNINFGQRPFSYTPPTGFKALNTQNLPTPTILKGNQFFDATTYTGNGTSQSVVNAAGFQPDFVWIKNRANGAANNILVDSVRGATNWLSSDLTSAESTNSAIVSSINSNGFSVGAANVTNQNATAIVAWQWKEGATQGFDIVTYTGTGANRTVAHSLGVKPALMIFKSRSNVTNWESYHSALGATKYVALNLTNAAATASTPFNNTEPTSSVFTVGTSDGTNFSGYTYVAYLFAEVAGFSKFGSYTGNGSADGSFVFTGHRPAFLLIKRTDTTSNWTLFDFKRAGYNVDNDQLYPNLSNAEATTDLVDLLSNGFKLRSTDASVNASGGTYIYAAFAEFPFKFSNAR